VKAVVNFRMPSLGADMEAGTLVEWLVKPGDRVKRGDIVAVVETQKGAIEVEIFESGKVEQILVNLGTKVPVGAPLADIVTDEEAKTSAAIAAPSGAATVPAVSEIRPPAQPAMAPPLMAGVSSAGRVRASPAARRLAQIRDVDLIAITGSGPDGAIVRADVERSLAALPSPIKKRHGAGLDLDAMRRAIAAAMARSKREIPHYYLNHQVDVGNCEDWLARTNARRSPDRRLLMGALTLKAVALAAHRFPAVNGFYRDGKYEPSDAIHAGVAIAIRGGGLAAPAIHDADRLALDDLMARLRDLVQRMRSGRIRSSEIADATITVSSLGERGVDTLYGVIYPPQVAIVGVGKVVTRPCFIDGAVGPRSVITITLAADHRVSDGHVGALFLAEIAKLLQEPEKL
jgi:pyruvate dehydrogenase E2 component (dihydrolipoamide acetyltransferase)